MADADNPYERAIADLVARIEDRLTPIIEDKRTVNKLCGLAGVAPRYPDVEAEGARGSMIFRRDQFVAKPLATAIREYLERRGRSDRGGLGAATVNEIFDALLAGGYKPDTGDETNAKRGLRIALSKNSQTFWRVPGGSEDGAAYGLLEWYEKAKPQTVEDSDKTPKRKRGRPPKIKGKRGRPPKAKPTENVVNISAAPPKGAAGVIKNFGPEDGPLALNLSVGGSR